MANDVAGRSACVLLGKPGCRQAGRRQGHAGESLAEHYGVEHLSTGDLFRAQAALGTPSGLEAKRYMDEGELVPDEIVVSVVEECLAPGGPLEDGFVLDGFPRTLLQAQELDRVLDAPPLHLAINIDVPREIVLDRLAGRRVCENCQRVYHVNLPPTNDWTCDTCGGRVVQRDDDTEEAIDRRLELYEQETVPIIDYYRDLGELQVVDGVGDGDEVFERIVKAIDERFAAVWSCARRRRRSRTCGARDECVAEMHEVCTRAAKPGATTADLDRAAARRARSPRRPFELPRLPRLPGGRVHLAQRGDRARHPGRRGVLDDGDIVSIDCGAIVEGWHADAAITVPVGDDRRRVAAAPRGHPARRSRPPSTQVVVGHRLGDIGAAVEGIAEPAGFSVVREYVGHGIGTAMHEEPEVPNYGPAGRGMRLKEGIVLAIEPMVNAGGAATEAARRRLDRGHRRRLPFRPLRAHHRHHRRRPRGPHLGR